MRDVVRRSLRQVALPSSSPLRQLIAGDTDSSLFTDLISTNISNPSPSPSRSSSSSSSGYSPDGTSSIYSTTDTNKTVATYLYVFLGVMVALIIGSVLAYCMHQRRVRRFVAHDNVNNNMQRHSLVDSFIEAGEVEWQCTVCYHENHPAKRECLMCGTPQVISQQVVASPAHRRASIGELDDTQTRLLARNRSFHVRRLNERNLNPRQRGARRRNLWQREKTDDGQFRWVRIDDCRPSRLSLQDRPSFVPTSPRSDDNDSNSDNGAVDTTSYLFTGGSRRDVGGRADETDGVGVETELTMTATPSSNGVLEPTIRVKIDSMASMRVSSPTASDVVPNTGSDFIAQPSVGYVRHVDASGHVEWVPADLHVHAADAIDAREYPRASTLIDFESVAALSFRHKVRWFLLELEKVSVPWEDGHLLLKIRRSAVLNESMHLLMLVPASDLRQRLRIEFIDEPGLDAGGLMREWVLLLCEKLFDESFGLFQPTHVEHLGYWLNPNSRQIHGNDRRCYEFVGRLMAKCLLEGQLLTVHFALPLLKHVLGVPISFSDLEFLDAELYRNALWLRDHDGADALCLDFTVQRIDGNDTVVTDELKPGGRDIMVTDDNKLEYLTLLMKYRMFDSVKDQIGAILDGLYDVIPRSLLAVFDYQELELLICGVPQIDVDDWQDHTDVKCQSFDQPTKAERRAVDWFWDVVRSFSQEQRARLLQFVTGTSRVPVEGFKALLSNDGRVRRFGIQLVARGPPPAGLYPKAHTCFNRIDLPLYDTKDELETYLTLVINMEITGFSMQ